MEKITSLQNQKIKDLKKLNEKKYRDRTKTFLVEGYHILSELKDSELLVEVFVREGCKVDSWVSKYIEISSHIADSISKTSSNSDVFAVVKYPEIKSKKHNKVIICDGIQDPGNLGTIIRTAYSFGVDAIYCSEACVDFYNDKVLRATQGALFHIYTERTNLVNKIIELKTQGLNIYGTDVHGGKEMTTFSNSPCAIVLGNEGDGVSEEVLAVCDEKIYIQTTNFESLNVAIACGILCHYFKA